MDFQVDLADVHRALEAHRELLRQEGESAQRGLSFGQEWADARAALGKMRNWRLRCGGQLRYRVLREPSGIYASRGWKRRGYMLPIYEDVEVWHGIDDKRYRWKPRPPCKKTLAISQLL